jgi:hypothetical protein
MSLKMIAYGFCLCMSACYSTPEVREIESNETTDATQTEPERLFVTIGDFNDVDGSNPPLCGGLSILLRYTINDDGELPDYAIFENQGNLELYSNIKRRGTILVEDYSCSADYGALFGCNLEEHVLGVQLMPNDELIITVSYLVTDALEYNECETIQVTLPGG